MNTVIVDMLRCINEAPLLLSWLQQYNVSEDWEVSKASMYRTIAELDAKDYYEKNAENVFDANVIGILWLRFFANPNFAEQKIRDSHPSEYDISYFSDNILRLSLLNHIPLRIKDPDFSLAEVDCPFSEEQIKESGINKNVARIVLAAVNQQKSQYTQNNYWLTPFVVMLNHRWIEDNMAAYCNMAKSLWGADLDPRTMSKERKNIGIDYENWTDSNSRIRARKKLVIDLESMINDRIKEVKRRFLNDLK